MMREFFLDPWSWPEEFDELGSVRPSFCPSIRKFSWYWLISFFLKLSLVLEVNMVLCVTEPEFWGKYFCPRNRENGPKMFFFNILENLVFIFFPDLVFKES